MDIPSISMQLPALSIPKTDDSVAPAADGNAAGTAIGGFGKALTNAIEGLNQVQNDADDKSVQLAAGEPIDLHEVMLARETASLDFQLALQVRNKLVEAYQDVMRMQV
jgi:flagellar hook-basal body complex protein FliE